MIDINKIESSATCTGCSREIPPGEKYAAISKHTDGGDEFMRLCRDCIAHTHLRVVLDVREVDVQDNMEDN